VNVNRWWATDSNERFWVETTDRADVGVDLNAPQLDESGQVNWRYSLIEEVRDGDVVYHYRKQRRAITAWSWAVGSAVADRVRWAAHGTSARGRGVVAYERPGWRLGLEGPFPLTHALRLDQIAARGDDVHQLVADLRQQYGSLYFPSSSHSGVRRARSRATSSSFLRHSENSSPSSRKQSRASEQ
jgi:hypothetical protein